MTGNNEEFKFDKWAHAKINYVLYRLLTNTNSHFTHMT